MPLLQPWLKLDQTREQRLDRRRVGTERLDQSSRERHYIKYKIWVPGAENTSKVIVLRYRVHGGLRFFEDHDELYWNAVGHTWPVPIEQVTVDVAAPGPITDALCFQGPEGSSLPCDRQRVNGDAARFHHADLGPYAGVTIVLALPNGVLDEPAPILEERWSIGSAALI